MTDHPLCPNMAKLIPNLTYSIARLIAIAALTLCVCCTSETPPANKDNGDQATITLARLQTLCETAPFSITEELICEAYVIGGGTALNNLTSIYVEQLGVCAEVMTGLSHSADIYPLGTRLYINLQGCYATINENILQIGLAPLYSDSTTPEKFGHQAVADIHLKRTSERKNIIPHTLRIEELSEQWLAHCVRIDDLQHSPTEPSERNFMEYTRLTDESDAEVWLYIYRHSHLIGTAVPQGSISISGIAKQEHMDGKSVYVIVPITESDIISSGN